MSFEKLKIFVAASLFLVILIATTLFLIAYTDSSVFPYLFFLFSLFWIAVFIPRSISKLTKWEIGLIIFVVILAASSLTLFANSVKAYSDREQQTNNLQLQIDEISNSNEYYSNYSAYLIKAIKQSAANANTLQDKINKLNIQLLRNTTTKPADPVIIQPVIELEEDGDDEDED